MIKKIKSKFNNRGSSFVMLIVTIAFLSVLATSILVAVGFSYQLKVYNLNSRNNFYYVEQALDEIYAGIGNIAVANLRQAYSDTLEILVSYDTVSKEYVPMADEDANLLMKKTFMQYMKNDTSLSMAIDSTTGNEYLKDTISSCVTNSDIVVDLDNVQLDVTSSDALVIRNVTVKRTAQYASGNNTGDYIQSITTDISIGEPAYNVSFSQDSALYNSLYDFAMVADAGIEITGATSQVNVSGNIYAAADFYNKDYEGKDEDGNVVVTNTYSGASTDVSSYLESETRYQECDGLREQSMYSGLYISAANVILQSSTLIVPGSLAVFNGAQLVVSAKENGSVVPSDMWVDNINLGGYTPLSGASRADIYANAHVYDDLTIDSDSSTLKMEGEYYGYNYSQSADTRTFVEPAQSNYQDAYGDNTNDHYNSSSIILNGQDTTLDFEGLSKLYIAGRSYVEMSKKVSKAETALSDDETVETKTYTYDNSIKDYITGESLSIKSNQLAYMPIKTWSIIEDDGDYYIEIPSNVQEPYEGFFSQLSKVPVIKQTVSGTDFYFFDFGTETDSNGDQIYKDVDKAKFIQTYAEYFVKDATGNYSNSGAKYLKNITDYTRFQVAEISLPKDINIYSNGALTVKDATTFSIKASASSNVFDSLLTLFNDESNIGYMAATNELSSEYEMMRYLLTIDSSSESKTKVTNKVAEGVDFTPFETYFNVASITDLAPTGKTLENGYRVWVSSGDVEISDPAGNAQGIVIAKGDVTFAANMKSFRGLIVSGSKIYINHSMNFFADATIAKSTLQWCSQLTEDATAQAIVACFKEYDNEESGGSSGSGSGSGGGSTTATDVTSLEKKITEIDYNDVISFVNWKKNVE